MNLMDLNWGLLAPEFTIVIVATIITLADLFMNKTDERKIFGWLGLLGILVAIYFTIQQLRLPEVEYLLHNTYRVDSIGSLFKLILLAGTGIVFILSVNYIDRKEIKYGGELYYLLLTSLLGGMMMASSADLITLYVGLELLSVSSFVLVGIRKKNLKSNEAAYKYVVTGGSSSAIFLFGASYIYGLTGTSNIIEMGQRLPEAFTNGYDFYIYLGFFMMLVGLSYKISVVPTYMWAPDVYEGAATPITAFLSVVSKAAGFAIIIRIFLSIFAFVMSVNMETMESSYFFFDDMTLYISILAGITMIVGNTLAMRQTNVKRLLAYSSVAQAGYILVPFAVLTYAEGTLIASNVSNIIFYLFAYLLMNLGVFAVATIAMKDAGTEDIKSFAGLYHRSPLIGVAMTVFLLSLAGLPISAGFIGKFNIFVSAIGVKSYYLAAIMLLTSVISYFYYFNIARQMYMRPGHTEAKLKVPFSIQFVVLLSFLGVLLIGLLPNVAYDFIVQNFDWTHLFTMGNGQ